MSDLQQQRAEAATILRQMLASEGSVTTGWISTRHHADGTPCKTCGGSGGWFSGEKRSDPSAIWRRLRMAEAEVADPEGSIPDVRSLCEDLRFALTQLDAVEAERDAAVKRARHSESVLNALRGKR